MTMATSGESQAFIYLDNNATTPCDPRVVDAMLPWFGMQYGNPANGLHVPGRQAARAVEKAREQVAGLINALPGEIVFTSGATESNNLVIFGLARAQCSIGRNHIITSAIEHKAVLLPCKALMSEGFDVSVVPVDEQGRVSLDLLESVVNDRTLLVSIQAANNEIGTLQDIRKIAHIAHAQGAIFHTDAAQAVGKVPVDVDDWDADFLSMSAHKLYGPKGCGCLYVRRGPKATPLTPLTYGGGQEHGLRSGTLNVPGIVGMGEACFLAGDALGEESNRIVAMRDRFEEILKQWAPKVHINGDIVNRLPNTSSLTIAGVDADALLLNLPHIALGTGSACTTGAIEPSHVLQAIGLSRADACATVRVSLGRFTTLGDVEFAAIDIARKIGESLTRNY